MKETLTNDEGRIELRIRAPKEFRFSENLKYLSRSSNECLFDIVDQKIYRALDVENETFLIEISAMNEMELTVRFPGRTAPMDNQVKDAVSQYVRHWFDLETNLLPFYEMAQKDPLLQKPVSQFFGLRNMGIPDLFEAIAWGILGQQINLTYAYTLKRRLVEGFGDFVEFAGKRYWLFPKPDAIAKLTVEDFADLRMTVKKCEYLIGVSQLIAEGELTKEKLLNAKDEKEAEKMLTNIRGIGPWTANYVLMRCLRFPAAFPIDDVGLHNSMKLVLQTEAKSTKAEIRKLSEAWADWESYATFYLWRLLY
ncbi:DNA-3-methyladenine glycosylase 2 family protein [Bacillus sp. SD075]|uniref:DNA-3-methyladenine glycosylase family protein n=1 Tax=Bacillus sp. SD075 TaxID=2781732 RepID=UPI001A96C2AE|nr:DNA-3-methyladenine glycosylase [Bacillus sp. SD075]MBO0999902.1 DNA-3-methyladenine glycosylase 2 family protein [Bacillus sp. SD075]